MILLLIQSKVKAEKFALFFNDDCRGSAFAVQHTQVSYMVNYLPISGWFGYLRCVFRQHRCEIWTVLE